MTTPVRRQYLDLKQRYPDTVLFFRLGDFYETFDDDARLAAEVLQITLTSKPMGKDIRVPLAGVPYHSIDGHVAKLVAAGYRVAVCEQMADPAEVKGIVPRDVVRVVTAGTVTSDNSLEPAAPNYLAALVTRGATLGLAMADVTTGEIVLSRDGGAQGLLASSPPAELLIEDETAVPAAVACVSRVRPVLSATAVEAALASCFGDQARSALVDTEAEAAALAHVVEYVRLNYAAALGAFQRVRSLSPAAVLTVDQRTLANLDVLPLAGRRSLHGVLNRTRSSMGARLLREWLTRPLRDAAAIGARLDGVEWSLQQPLEREGAHEILKSIPDLGRLAGKIGARSAGPRDMAALRDGLRRAFDLGTAFTGIAIPALLSDATAKLAHAAEPLAGLDAAIADDPPATFDDGGVIRAGFLPEVDSLRSLTSDARGFLVALEQEERDRTGIRSLKVGHNRVFGYYIEVSSANAGLVPAHYQRRQTLVGAERYVTEEMKEHESRLIGARDRLVELERQAFGQLLETLAAQLAGLQAVAAGVATIDLLLSLGEVASEKAYVRPEFGEDHLVLLAGARHPVVEDALGPGRFVPNDCDIGGDRQILLLTGPNMAGKSTFLRQVALIALMAQAGCYVPADRAVLPIFDRIFTRIGAQDDLAAGQSTFMVEMVETAQILHQATPDSLVVLDEVGRGTSTFDGMAIARAVVEFIHNRPELAATTLFATHYHELTDLAEILPRVHNAHVAVHEDAGDVVFEHRILPGRSDRSYGVHVAKLAGLPASVVARAERLLDEFERNGSGVPARGMGSMPPSTEAAPVVQASFFGGPSAMESAVAAIDVDSLSPLEAIQKLYELKAIARGLAQGLGRGGVR